MCEDSTGGDTIEGPDVVGLMCPIIVAEFTSRLADGPTNAQPKDPTHERCSPCGRATRLATMPFITSRRSWTGWRWPLENGRNETERPRSVEHL